MYPALFTTPGIRALAEELDAERQRQIDKFGEQHHPDGTGAEYYVGMADEARNDVERFVAQHSGPEWALVLLEEVYEALAESDPAKLRAELVQVAAVCAAWITDIDSRTPAAEQPKPVPRTEREHWVDIANALNAAADAGMPVGIDLDGTLTDHKAWSVIWDAAAERWTVAGYDEDVEERPACGKCKQPLDPAQPRTRNAHQPEAAYCHRCVDRCHDNEIADHRCVICA